MNKPKQDTNALKLFSLLSILPIYTTSSKNDELTNLILAGWINLVESTKRIHAAVSTKGELAALILGDNDTSTDHEDVGRATLETGLPVEELFKSFTVRWIEMRYDHYALTTIPKFIEVSEWKPISFSDGDGKSNKRQM